MIPILSGKRRRRRNGRRMRWMVLAILVLAAVAAAFVWGPFGKPWVAVSGLASQGVSLAETTKD